MYVKIARPAQLLSQRLRQFLYAKYPQYVCSHFRAQCDILHGGILEFGVAGRASFIVASKDEEISELFYASRLAVKCAVLYIRDFRVEEGPCAKSGLTP